MFNEDLADRIVEFLAASFPNDGDFDTLKRELAQTDDAELLNALDALEKRGLVHGGFIRTGIDQFLQAVYSVALTTAGRDVARRQGMGDILKLEQLGNHEFDKTRRNLYEEATGMEAANLRERLAKHGMAQSSSFAQAAVDLVFAQFQKLKTAFLKSYLETLVNTPLGITAARRRWLARKLDEVWTNEVDRAKRNALLLAGTTGMLERDTAPYVDGLVTRCLDLKVDVTNEIETAALRQELGLSRMSSEVNGAHSSSTTDVDPDRTKRVFVIHGRDERLRKGIFEFLRSIGLEPQEWPQLLSRQESASPFIGTIVEEAFKNVQAVVALLTPDEHVALRADLTTPGQNDAGFQPRPNVLFETGMAFSTHPDRTVLVQIGQVRPFSDIGGRYIVHLDDSSPKRQQLADRLRAAGCAVNLSGTDWHATGDLAPPKLEPKPPSAAVTLKPNIRFVRNLNVRVSRVFNVAGEESLAEVPYTEINDDNRGLLLQAAVACFRNESLPNASTVPDAYGVDARILYLDRNGNEIDDIAKGYWLSPYENSVIMPLSVTRSLILMLMFPNGDVRAPSKGRYIPFRTGHVANVVVRLIHRNTQLDEWKFELTDDNNSVDAFILP